MNDHLEGNHEGSSDLSMVDGWTAAGVLIKG